MKALLHRSLMLRARALCFMLLCWLASESLVPLITDAATSRPAKRDVQFELSQEGFTGDQQAGKSLTFSITLLGFPSGSVPIVATCESNLFRTQTVTLEPDTDAESTTMKATVTLEPMPQSRTSVHQNAARIQVTFARQRKQKLQRFMRRIVYVTLDHPESSSDTVELPPLSPEELSHGNLIIVDEAQPDVTPVSSAELSEEDLLPLANPSQGQAYWKQVSYLVSRSWARQVRAVRRGPTSESVRVHFRLYPNGRAQLIEIEKGAGSHEINVAGIYAVADAQPFPPFPTELGDEAVDVHVRMRTGPRPRSREVQSVGARSTDNPDAPASSKK
ncbi:MAG TPA: TonB C-terminal domain-containing protein [Nitrospira sp.]